MYYRLIFGLLGAVVFALPVVASEDMPDIMFGADEAAFAQPEAGSVEELDFLPEDAMAAFVDAPPATLSDVNPNKRQAMSPAEDVAPLPMLSAPAATDMPMAQEMAPPASDMVSEEAAPAPIPSAAKGENLTDALKKDTAAKEPAIPLPKVEGTWVNKLASSNPLDMINADKKQGATLEKMVQDARGNKPNNKSNASVFDISGIMLRMSLGQVDEIMQNRGFRKIMQKYQIPNFIKWRNEEYCRNNGVVGYERTEACVVEKAKKDKHQYVQTTKYAKFDTKEEVEVTFTSNFTENKVYKINYTSTAAGITGNSPKAIYMRNIKIYDFWKKINQKYGKPDDKDAVTWGMGDNKPYLKAKTGNLLLEDPMLRELDYTRMSREDQRYLNTDLYSF